MRNPAPFIASLAVFTSMMAASPEASADSPLQQAVADAITVRGLVVVAGMHDTNEVAPLLKESAIVLLIVAKDQRQQQAWQTDLAKEGVVGQATVVTLDGGRIPLGDNSAATVAADLDQIDGLTADELRRITRPFGTVHVKVDSKWTQSTLPRPEGMDDWTHYHHDPANTEHSQDTTVGPARGLQWIAGPTNQQDANWVFHETVLTTHVARGVDHRRAGLMARDAFSGLPIWYRSDLRPLTRFAVVLDDKHVFLHAIEDNWAAPHTVALDRHTGETVKTFDQGLDFTVTKEEVKQDRRAPQYAMQRAADLQLRLIDGLLVQVIRDEVVVLDAATGERKWHRKAEEEKGFVHPTAGGGLLYLVEGEYTRHSSYTHWPMAKPEKIHALQLADGKPRWTFSWNADNFGQTHAIYNLQLEGERLAGAVTIQTKTKPAPHGLVLNAKTGELAYWGREDGAWPGNTGHGHSHVRMHLRDDQAWTFAIGGPIATWHVDEAAKTTLYPEVYKQNMRPVSCTVWRSTPAWWFGGIGSYPVEAGGRGYFNSSGRSNCDIGAFPANGLIYNPPNTCQCQPYLPGNKAYHSRPAPEPATLQSRLLVGDAKPAPDKTSDQPQWPIWQGDAARRTWLHAKTPTDLQQAWRYEHSAPDAPALVQEQWKTDAFCEAAVTQANCAEGIVVLADAHRHQVVALDPGNGKELWRQVVDGRVDMAPTIHRGLVLAGTRNGYVYALNRDTGALVWRFLAAPHDDRIVVNGQLESPWPVVGSIPVDNDGLLAIAGRHSDSDGGLWWWHLEPATGKVLASGRIGHDEPPAIAANWPRRRPIELPSVQNSVAVMTDNWFIMPGANIRRIGGRLGEPGDVDQLDAAAYATKEQMAESQLRDGMIKMGSSAMFGERSMIGGWRKPYFANTIARIYAIGDGEFVSVGGGLGTAGGRGGGGGSFVHRMRLLDKPVEHKRPEQQHRAEVVWEHNDKLLLSRERPSVSALAVSESAVYLGMSIYGRDKLWREESARMAHRLRIINMADGTLIRDVALPGRVLPGGIALTPDKILVATADGSVTAFVSRGP